MFLRRKRLDLKCTLLLKIGFILNEKRLSVANKRTMIMYKKLYESNNNIKPCCLMPAYQKDFEKLSKLKEGELFEVETFTNRNLNHHRKLFGICNEFCNNDFFIQMLDKWEQIQSAFDISLILDNTAIQELRFKHKSDSYTFIYICKFLFLPLEEIILPDGKVLNIVSSINFRDMDQLAFEEFYSKAIELLAFIIGVSPEKLS